MFDKDPAWWQLAIGYVVLGVYCGFMACVWLLGWCFSLPARGLRWLGGMR
jgi:hypothetical protein